MHKDQEMTNLHVHLKWHSVHISLIRVLWSQNVQLEHHKDLMNPLAVIDEQLNSDLP